MGYAYDGIASGLAAQIRALRSARGWTQPELARRSGISLESVQLLENPRGGCDLDIRKLLKIAAAFDIALVTQFIPVSAMVAEIEASCSPERLAPPSFTEEFGEGLVSPGGKP